MRRCAADALYHAIRNRNSSFRLVHNSVMSLGGGGKTETGVRKIFIALCGWRLPIGARQIADSVEKEIRTLASLREAPTFSFEG